MKSNLDKLVFRFTGFRPLIKLLSRLGEKSGTAFLTDQETRCQ